MRKTRIISALFITAFLLTSCGNLRLASSPAVKDFSQPKIDNTYNNINAGSHMVFYKDKLYVSFGNVLESKGVYSFDKNGAEKVFDTQKEGFETFPLTVFDDKLYCGSYDDLYLFNGKTFNKIKEVPESYKYLYNSEDLKIQYKYGKNDRITDVHIKYKNDKDYSLKKFINKKSEVYNCYVYKNNVYFSVGDSVRDYLYVYNVKKKGEPELVEGLNEPSLSSGFFFVDDDYIYYIGSDEDEVNDGVYVYSIKEKKNKLICDTFLNNGNYYNGKLYFSNEKGVYSYDGKKLNKIYDTDVLMDIYFFDEKYLYLLDNASLRAFRISTDGKTVERLSLV